MRAARSIIAMTMTMTITSITNSFSQRSSANKSPGDTTYDTRQLERQTAQVEDDGHENVLARAEEPVLVPPVVRCKVLD